MIYDCKRMDLYRIVTDDMSIKGLSKAIEDALVIQEYGTDPTTTYESGNFENMPIIEQVECTLEAHGNMWPEAYPVYYTAWNDHRPSMEIAWFRFVEQRKD